MSLMSSGDEPEPRPTPFEVETTLGPVPCRRWGDGTQDVLLLVHGATANQHWWDHIAPSLAKNRTVVTLDLSGHGEAPHRSPYSYPRWAREVTEVAAIIGKAPVTLVGHSMGGAVCLLAAQSTPSVSRQVITIDTMVREASAEETTARRDRANRRHRVYASKHEALDRFHTLPPSSRAHDHFLRSVAEHSVTPVPQGWSWKFDLRVLGIDLVSPDDLHVTEVPTVLIRADDGLVDAAMEADVLDRLGRLASARTISDCGHHVMLERPAELIRELELALAPRTSH